MATSPFSFPAALFLLMSAPFLHASDYVVDIRNSAAADTNPGTAAQPFKTVGAAVGRIQPGDTITIKAGVYREHVQIRAGGTAEKPVIIQAAAGERVVITGADLLTGWAKIADPKNRPIWEKTPFGDWANCNNAVDGLDRKTGPQLIVDNAMLRRVASTDQMKPGTYCYDPARGGAVYLWMTPPIPTGKQDVANSAWWDEPVALTSDDPNKHQVEASVRPEIITMTDQSYVTIRGLVARYSTDAAQEGAFNVSFRRGKSGNGMAACDHDTIENCVVEYCHGRGLTTCGDHMTVRGCYLRYNGSCGAGGNLRDSLWEDDVLDGNSTLGISPGFEAGGTKFVFTTGLVVRRCQFINNFGPGLWFDTGNSGNTAEQNYCSFNEGAGIMFEVSPDFDSTGREAKAVIGQRTEDSPDDRRIEATLPVRSNIIRNNICVGNYSTTGGGIGILLQLASQTEVLNNTLVGNGEFGIFVRYHPYDSSGHRCIDNTILNNLCVDNGPDGHDQIGVTPDPVSQPGFVARNRSDYNLFWCTRGWLARNPANNQPNEYPDEAQFAKWGKTQFNGAYSVEEMFKIWGLEEHSIQRLPHFVSASSFDYRPMPDSSAVGAGTAHADIGDDFLGRKRSTERPPSIGALEYFPGDTTPPAMPMRGVAPVK